LTIKIRATKNATEWVKDLLNGAIADGITDLQLVLDRDEQKLSVRARENRVMAQVAACEGTLAMEVVNRIKTISKIPTGPAQAIADGLYEHDTGMSKHDLRVALFPSVTGEALALRLPARQDMPVLEDIKFNPHNRERLNVLLGMANGLMLMAGPMGAGKTTTMYAILGFLGGDEKNVFTVEDPVERLVPGAVQIQINENARNGWPHVLRGLRRSDLEVLMIGEIRNGEQANAALEVGNAGAKVVSSIHANDSVGAVHQILELSKTSPRMLGNQLRGVVSQRLVRLLHTECEGAGCASCDDSGYKGVQPIHEVLLIDDDLVQAMVEGASASKLREVARRNGMMTLNEGAELLVAEGLTNIKEIERVLGTAHKQTQVDVPTLTERVEDDQPTSPTPTDDTATGDSAATDDRDLAANSKPTAATGNAAAKPLPLPIPRGR
jgi:general secretion pathway protein E